MGTRARRRRVLFLYMGGLSTFKQSDLEILAKYFEVRVLRYGPVRHPFGILLKVRVLKGVLWADLTYSWFAGEHAFWAAILSKVLRKKSIVVAGGGEVARVPEIDTWAC